MTNEQIRAIAAEAVKDIQELCFPFGLNNRTMSYMEERIVIACLTSETAGMQTIMDTTLKALEGEKSHEEALAGRT